MRFVLAAMVGCILIAVSPISAKEIGVFNDWSAHVEGNGKSRTCWIYSKPVKHEGRYKKRGPIFSYITHVFCANVLRFGMLFVLLFEK